MASAHNRFTVNLVPVGFYSMHLVDVFLPERGCLCAFSNVNSTVFIVVCLRRWVWVHWLATSAIKVIRLSLGDAV